MDLAKTLQPRRATGLPNNPLNKLGAVNNAQPASFDTGQTLNVDVGGGGGRTSGASLQQQNTSFTGNQTPVYDLSKIIKQPQQQIF
ncbi:MAG: hypothetical protein LBG59_07460 [Candidatus Peribacteria bacterium]|jgi:hypothetical protein|nr:hypothetical protein [Candidatus Peribacteria bacterium]